MYDFCFTYPYAGLLALGGLSGFIAKGSIPSLVNGLVSGGVLALLATWSYSSYNKGEVNKPVTAISGVVSSGLCVVMYKRYTKTGNFMPAGLVLIMSIIMTLFYVWSIFYGPVPSKKKS